MLIRKRISEEKNLWHIASRWMTLMFDSLHPHNLHHDRDINALHLSKLLYRIYVHICYDFSFLRHQHLSPLVDLYEWSLYNQAEKVRLSDNVQCSYSFSYDDDVDDDNRTFFSLSSFTLIYEHVQLEKVLLSSRIRLTTLHWKYWSWELGTYNDLSSVSENANSCHLSFIPNF